MNDTVKNAKEFMARRDELVSQIKNDTLSVTDAKLSLAGWLLKQREEKGNPPGIITHNQTTQQNAYYNASASLNMGLED